MAERAATPGNLGVDVLVAPRRARDLIDSRYAEPLVGVPPRGLSARRIASVRY